MTFRSRSTVTRMLMCTCLSMLLSACVPQAVVYAPTDFVNDPPSGSVSPLGKLVPASVHALRLIFIHGVGDHCYGYALDAATGWLKDETAARIGLTALGPTSPAHSINVATFIGGAVDLQSYVQYATRPFLWTKDAASASVAVQAIEITWSPLTQWIKTNQLSYDSPSATTTATTPPGNCIEPPDPRIVPAVKPPPSRVLLDRIIKEEVFDRDLSDAIIYAGTYGAVIERGVAEALCHALTGQRDDVRCAWPTKDDSGSDINLYLFVTHSLGSRILYDTLLDLLGYDAQARSNPFTNVEVTGATPFVSNMLANTPAVYMMANQLALLGLANVPSTVRSESGVHPFAPPMPAPISGDGAGSSSVAAAAPPAKSTEQSCHNLAAAVGDARAKAAERLGRPRSRLQLIAFNDTDDLLTWHIPAWYVNQGPSEADCRPEIDVANVFVQNATRWLVVVSPAAAHANYFTNAEVWNVIRCGAVAGRLTPCR